MGSSAEYDVVVVGASIAGCSTAIFLARAGANVLLVERSPDIAAHKTVCGHYIQGGTIPTIERLGLLEPMVEAGAVRPRLRMWTDFGGWIESLPPDVIEPGINLRRKKLDPLIRGIAANEYGVELRLGQTLVGLTDEGTAVTVEMKDRTGKTTSASAPLIVGADGRTSTVAKLAEFKERKTKNARFNYGGYFEGPAPAHWPDVNGWFLNPQWAGAFPTDSGLTGYYMMPTKDRLPAFKADREAAMRAMIAELPGAPPVDELTLVGEIVGDVELPGFSRSRTKGRVALVGDAALTSDPLFGVGCGWAFQSAEWLSNCVAPAITGDMPMKTALRHYRRAARRRLGIHPIQTEKYANGRKFDPVERLMFKSAARDPKVAAEFQRAGSRSASGAGMVKPANVARMLKAGLKRSPAASADME